MATRITQLAKELPSTYQHALTYVDNTPKIQSKGQVKSTRHWYCTCGEYYTNLTNLKNHIIDKNGVDTP